MNIEVEVIRVEAVSRRLDAKWTIAENVTMNVTQGPPIWKRITG